MLSSVMGSRPPKSAMSDWNNVWGVFFIALFLGLASTHAQAADAPDSFELSPEQLFNATVISVSKTPEKIMDAPAAIFVLTNEDIMRSGATSIPEALRLVPGVQVAQVNANSWAISVRGFNSTLSNKLLVLIDGREVYDPLFSGVYWDVQDTVLEDIDRIEVVRGPGGTLWGDNAVDGVINIITKKASETQGSLTSVTGGNHEDIAEQRYGGVISDNGFYRAYAKYTDRGNEETITGQNDHDGWTEGHGGFRADWDKIGIHDDSMTVQGDVYRSDAGQLRFLPNLTTGENPLTDEEIAAQGGNLLERWTRTYADDSKLTVQSYIDSTYRDQLLIKDQRTSIDLDTQYELPEMTRQKFIVGAHYRYSDDELTGTPDVTVMDGRDHDQIIDGFVQDKITLEPKTWFLTLGSKFEYNTFSGSNVQPNARLQWHPDEDQMVWAAASRAVRTPSVVEQEIRIVQTALAPSFPLNTLPNPDLYSEGLTAYELGYRRQITPDVSADIATFYNIYDELSTTTLNSFHFLPPFFLNYAPENSTNGETHGIESTLDWHALDNLRFSASGSFLTMKLRGPPSPTALGADAADTQSPNFQGNLRAQWDVTENVSFDTILYRTSALSGFLVPSYTRLDMRLGWRIADGLEFDLIGQNLFDPEHQEFTSPSDGHVLPVDIGTSVLGKITCRF